MREISYIERKQLLLQVECKIYLQSKNKRNKIIQEYGRTKERRSCK